MMQKIFKAVKSGAFQMADDTVILQINNQEERLEADVILVTYQAKDGQHVASNRGIVVSLDLIITEELREDP